jgi:hypothetical protein
MTPLSKRSPRRLVLQREEVRRLSAHQLVRVLGGTDVIPGYSAGACTDHCTSNQSTIQKSYPCPR